MFCTSEFRQRDSFALRELLGKWTLRVTCVSVYLAAGAAGVVFLFQVAGVVQ